MTKTEFVKKWIPFIGLGCAMDDEEREQKRMEATADLDTLDVAKWWRKWGEYYHGWPGGNLKRQVRLDLEDVE